MCESDVKKNQAEQVQLLIQAAHESERSRIRTEILQLREKIDFSTEEGMGAYNALTDVLNKIVK